MYRSLPFSRPLKNTSSSLASLEKALPDMHHVAHHHRDQRGLVLALHRLDR